MSSVWVIAGYDSEPTVQTRRDLTSQARRMVQQIFPQSTIDIETESGSWWLIVKIACIGGSAWLLNVFGQWAIARGLDQVADARGKNSILPRADKGNLVAAESISLREETNVTGSLDEKISQCLALARELNHGAPLRVLNIAEWDDERQEGLLLQIKLDQETEAMSFVKCRNIADLQRFMRSR